MYVIPSVRSMKSCRVLMVWVMSIVLQWVAG
jgi:hypothetical protein